MFLWNSLIEIPAPFMNLVSMMKKEMNVRRIPDIQPHASRINPSFNLGIMMIAYANISHAVIIPGEYGFFSWWIIIPAVWMNPSNKARIKGTKANMTTLSKMNGIIKMHNK